jgi:hypothetical protein
VEFSTEENANVRKCSEKLDGTAMPALKLLAFQKANIFKLLVHPT